MIREKGLSPRRARSRLPLSPRANSRLRLKPLLFLRPLPLQRRHTKDARLARFCTHYEYLFFDARPEGFRSSVRLRRMSSRPTARLRRKSTVCGLNRFLPNASRRRPPFKSSTPCSGLLLLRLFAPCSNVNCVSVLETKIAPRAHFSLQNGIQKIPGENRRTKANGPIRLGG
jgi:hypothetical protein